MQIGCNHKGEIKIAKNLMKVASESGVKIVKFQKRNNKELLTESQYNKPSKSNAFLWRNLW